MVARLHAVSVRPADSPERAAARIVDAARDEPGWLDRFTEALDRGRAGDRLRRILAVWGLNQTEAAELFGVTRQAVSRWLAAGVPTERVETVAALDAATDQLVRHLKRERIPAVVRRPAANLQGRSLLDLVREGDHSAVLEACRDMFAFGRASG